MHRLREPQNPAQWLMASWKGHRGDMYVPGAGLYTWTAPSRLMVLAGTTGSVLLDLPCVVGRALALSFIGLHSTRD